MILSLIVAASENGVIGKGGQMPWRLPAETAYFREVTLGHPVISGRKNYEAMGRPLPGRLNVVITRQTDYKVPDGVLLVHSLDEALKLPQIREQQEVFIIGGAQIYEQALPLADKLYLTVVHAQIDGDTFFKHDSKQWRLEWSQHHPADTDNKYAFTLQRFQRIQ